MALSDNFHIEARAKTMRDIQRSWDFQVTIPNIAQLAPKSATILNSDDLIIRTNSIQIPSSTTEVLEMLFMGTKQYFPGKRHNGGQVTCSFYELEDQGTSQVFYEWNQRIMNLNPDNDIKAGGSEFFTKRGIGVDGGYIARIYVQMFAYDKTPMPYRIALYNCWINNIDGLSLNWNSTEGLMQSVGFQCDYWKLENSTGTDLNDA